MKKNTSSSRLQLIGLIFFLLFFYFLFKSAQQQIMLILGELEGLVDSGMRGRDWFERDEAKKMKKYIYFHVSIHMSK